MSAAAVLTDIHLPNLFRLPWFLECFFVCVCVCVLACDLVNGGQYGIGVRRNAEEAHVWYSRAAEAGSVDSVSLCCPTSLCNTRRIRNTPYVPLGTKKKMKYFVLSMF